MNKLNIKIYRIIRRVLALQHKSDTELIQTAHSASPDYNDFLQLKNLIEKRIYNNNLSAFPETGLFEFLHNIIKLPVIKPVLAGLICTLVLFFTVPYLFRLADKPGYYSRAYNDPEFHEISLKVKKKWLSDRISAEAGELRGIVQNDRLGIISLDRRAGVEIIEHRNRQISRIILKSGAVYFSINRQDRQIAVQGLLWVPGLRRHAELLCVITGTEFVIEHPDDHNFSLYLREGRVELSSPGSVSVYQLTNNTKICITSANYTQLFMQPAAGHTLDALNTDDRQKINNFIPLDIRQEDKKPNSGNNQKSEILSGKTNKRAEANILLRSIRLDEAPRQILAVDQNIVLAIFERGIVQKFTQGYGVETIDLEGEITSAPLLAGSASAPVLIINSSSDNTWFIDTGKMKVTGKIKTGTLRYSGILKRGENFILVNSDGKLVIFNQQTVQYEKKISSGNFSDIFIDKNLLYTVSAEGELHCHNLDNNNMVWSKNTDERFIGSIFHRTDRGLYINNMQNEAYLITPEGLVEKTQIDFHRILADRNHACLNSKTGSGLCYQYSDKKISLFSR